MTDFKSNPISQNTVLNQPNYGIVVLSYNHPDLTEQAIESVLQLNFPEQQIYLVHNGSEEKNQLRLKKKFQYIQHILIAQNNGFTQGANQGLKTAFKYHSKVFFMTNDTTLLKIPTVFPDAVHLTSPLIYKRKTDQIDSVIGALDLRWGQLLHLRSIIEISSLAKNKILYAPGTAFGLSKNCYDTLMGFDESFHTYWEDVDFSYRAQQHGYKIEHTEAFQLRHKIGKTCHKNRFYTLYLFQRNRRLFFKKHNLLNFYFWMRYGSDLFKILTKILLRSEKKTNLTYWWKALIE